MAALHSILPEVVAASGEVTAAPSFADKAKNFSSYYYAVRDRANLSAFEYAQHFEIVARKMDIPLQRPPQSLFHMAVALCDDFMSGKVSPCVLQDFTEKANIAARNMNRIAELVNEGQGGYAVQGKRIMPKVINDSLRLLSLAQMIKAHTTPGGVSRLSPSEKQAIEINVLNERTALVRIRPDLKHQPR